MRFEFGHALRKSACHSSHSLLYCAKFKPPLRGKQEIFHSGENDGSESSILLQRMGRLSPESQPRIETNEHVLSL